MTKGSFHTAEALQRLRTPTPAQPPARAAITTLPQSLGEVIEPKFNAVDFCMKYEEGELGQDEIVAGFQELVNSGLIYSLQGHYQRALRDLVDAGLVTPNF